MKSKKMEFPDFTDSLSARDEGVDAMTTMIMKKFVDMISQSIKEMKVGDLVHPPMD